MFWLYILCHTTTIKLYHKALQDLKVLIMKETGLDAKIDFAMKDGD
jgi:hypothetical protein